jgi:hypothetical protein
MGLVHRVDKVLCFFSSRPNWDPPPPNPAGASVFPLAGGRGGGAGESHSDEGTNTVVL